jgi:epoxide hydrolase-like predicted phosphatase
LKTDKLENIIFDLGGVIINLDIDATFQRFSKVLRKEVKSDVFTGHRDYRFFQAYEVGEINSQTFRDNIRSLAGSPLDDSAIDRIWNAMLLDIPPERIKWIQEACANYNCVVLSNTNPIHIRHFNQAFQESTHYSRPAELFQKVFYSFEIGARKPDAESFEIVLEKTGFEPSKTVLLDDLKENLKTAERLGIQTVYVERNKLTREHLPYANQ